MKIGHRAESRSVKADILTSYAVQAYVGLIGVVLMPIYLRHLGVEAFGLVGLSLTLQALVQLLDLGLAPSLSRQMSLYRAGVLDGKSLRARLRSLEWILGALAASALLGIALSRSWVAREWLQVGRLSVGDVSSCLLAMMVAACARWLAGIYRSGLAGLERQRLVNASLAAFASLRFVGVLPLLVYWSIPPLGFFTYQALVGVCELVGLAALLYRGLPPGASPRLPDAASLRQILPTAGAMAFMSAVWIAVTQMDRVVLSRTLTLEAFGHYSIAVIAAGSVMMLVPPLHQVLQPRMTILVAQARRADLMRLYGTATQICSVAVSALGGGLAIFAQPVLWAWTGDVTVTTAAASILFWYSLANAVIALLVLPFMLQFAHGYLRLHVLGNIVLLVTLLPALIAVALHYGAQGTGMVIFAANVFFLLLWVPLAHRKLMPELTWRWVIEDVLPNCIATLSVLKLAEALMPISPTRLEAAASVVVAIGVGVVVGLAVGHRTRGLVVRALFRKGRA